MGTIGIAGTGRMGTAFARRLLETGLEVTVWNRTAERTGPAAGAGARVAKDLAALAGCDTILLSLTDASAVATVADEAVALPEERQRAVRGPVARHGAHLGCS